jgi:glycosyltransferase involved in cell wall biosynthesis
VRILHTESSKHLGGQELRILMEMEGLAPYGIESVLAAGPDTGIEREARHRGLDVHTVTMRGSVDPSAVARFLWILKHERIDLVCAHGSKDGWSAGIAARMLGLKVVRCRHVANPIRRHFFGRLVYGPLCDRIVTTAESIKAGMVERGVDARKIVSVPTGVDVNRFHPAVEKGSFRRELGVASGTPLVGMITVLRGDKGPDVFIEAAERFLGQRGEAFFVLVGDGWMRSRLDERVGPSAFRERILLTGFRRDIPQIISDLDVLVLSARIPEGVPQTILQAHAMLTPVVASDVGGINEVAIHGLTALTTAPGDADGVAQAVMELLADTEGARARALAGRELVLRHYTWPMTIARMRELYGMVCGSTPHRDFD